MKSLWMTGCALLLALPLAAEEKVASDDGQAKAAEAAPASDAPPSVLAPLLVDSPKKKASYALGLDVGVALSRQGFDPVGLELDVDMILLGIHDAVTRTKPRLTQAEFEEAKKMLEEYIKVRQNEAQAKMKEQEAEMKVSAAKNKAAGEAFLAENAKKEGVKTTESGLQYQVIKQGEGDQPAATDTVKVHYHGTLIDGKVFDSSVDRGEPVSFPLNRVIAGWTEGVQLMSVGAKYRFFIPSALAYGERGSPPVIQPNSTLIFEVELISINE